MNFLGLGRRHIQYTLLFFGILIALFIRSSLSIAIVAMTSETPPSKDIKTYPNWKNKDVILSSFFWGYVILQIPAGFFGHKFGPRYFVGVAFTVASTFTILSPYMASTMGSYGIMASRFIQGLSQSFLFPSVHNILSKWTPLPERSRTFAVIYASTSIGTTMAMPITGFICNSRFGWPAVFYSSGFLCLFWSIIFMKFGRNSPQEDIAISVEEKRYLEENISSNEDKKITIPWRSILTSIHFWAIVVAHGGVNFGFWTLLMEIPSFLHGVLKFDLKSNSVLSALPFFANFLTAALLSPISDYVIGHDKMSIQRSRKLFTFLGNFLPAFCLVYLSFISTDMKTIGVILLVTAVGTCGSNFVGYNINHIDIAPNFAGILMGISNCIGQIPTILGPLMVHIIVTDEKNMNQWRLVFLIAAGVFVTTSTFFLVFGSGKVQSWNNGHIYKEDRRISSEYRKVPTIEVMDVEKVTEETKERSN